MFLLVKIALTVALVTGVAELSKHNARAAAALNALPIQSLIIILWLYLDTRDVHKVGELAHGMLWMLPLTFFFFVVLAMLLKLWGALWPALATSLTILLLTYSVYGQVIRRFR
jgi:hypothetical protein